MDVVLEVGSTDGILPIKKLSCIVQLAKAFVQTSLGASIDLALRSGAVHKKGDGG